MRYFFQAARLLVADLAGTLLFLAAYLLTKNISLSVGLGMALGAGQIGWCLARRKAVDAMAWMSFVLILGSGAASIVTNDPRFVMLKPTVIYCVVGVFMLQPGWMTRYLPPVAHELASDVAFALGYAWSALMFGTAILNVWLVMNVDAAAWASVMAVFGIVSKVLLFLIGFALLMTLSKRRRRTKAAAGS